MTRYLPISDNGRMAHGRSRTPEYKAWKSMRYRCNNPRCHAYPNYGARGITVCAAWAVFAVFLRDMGPCPPRHTIDRIDVNGNYEPSNCRWADALTQGNNKRDNVILQWRGESRTMAQWARVLGVRLQTLKHRIDRGWDTTRIFTQPFRPPRYSKQHHR